MIIGVVVPGVVLLVLLSGYAAVRLWPFVVAVLACLGIGFVVSQGRDTAVLVTVVVLVLGVVFFGAVRASNWLEGVVAGWLRSGRHREREDV